MMTGSSYQVPVHGRNGGLATGTVLEDSCTSLRVLLHVAIHV